MASVTPGGSATATIIASPTFPLMPPGWPLTIVPASDPVGTLLPQNPNPPSTAQSTMITNELTSVSHTTDRLV